MNLIKWVCTECGIMTVGIVDADGDFIREAEIMAQHPGTGCPECGGSEGTEVTE